MEWLAGLMGHLVGGVLGNVIELTLGVLAPVIAGLVVKLLVKQLKKLNVQLTNEQEKQIEALVMQAIRYVEEMSSKHQTMTPDEKREMAGTVVHAQRPDLDPIDIARRVHAALPKVRAEIAPGRTELLTINSGLPGGGRR